jgi:hypothetical protein
MCIYIIYTHMFMYTYLSRHICGSVTLILYIGNQMEVGYYSYKWFCIYKIFSKI